jgi:argininosuccinate lyase
MAKDKQATWGGRFSEGPADLMLRFSESVSFDQRLAPFDILVNKAHTAMLHRIGVLTAEELDVIHRGLTVVQEMVESGGMAWDQSLEDVHMNIEQTLHRAVPAASKMHTARSRNDQIATDMRLFFKAACRDIEEQLRQLIAVLVELAQRTTKTYIPGYTHLQRAQPVAMAHQFLAYAEMFDRDRRRFLQVAANANFCPLGSGAIAGTTLPIEREFVAQYLGFVDSDGKPQVTRNGMDAVSDRDLFIEFTSACAMCGLHFSRVAEDMILWSSQEFHFVELPDAFCTGSSLMPQKKNPDSMELLRGKSARLHGNHQTLCMLVKGLPFTYNRDLQEDKPPVFDSFDQTMLSLQVLGQTLAGLRPDEASCAKAVADPLLLATDLADYLVLKGVAFRKAHHVVGALVKLAEDKKTPINQLSLTEVQGVCELLDKDWIEVFQLETAMAKRIGTGMPGPVQVQIEIERWRALLDQGSAAEG